MYRSMASRPGTQDIGTEPLESLGISALLMREKSAKSSRMNRFGAQRRAAVYGRSRHRRTLCQALSGLLSAAYLLNFTLSTWTMRTYLATHLLETYLKAMRRIR